MSKALAPSVTARDSKGLKFVSVVEAAYNKTGLTEEEAQRVNDTPGLPDVIRDFIDNSRSPNKYKNEEARSRYGYLSGYKGPGAITDQIDILRKHWPTLNPDAALRYYREVYSTLAHPGWVEGAFALIRPGFFSDKYGEEVGEVLEAIKKDRGGKFHNYREGQLNEQHLRQLASTLAATRALVERQPNSDILIVGANFGIRYPQGDGTHIVSSVRRAREKVTAGEFGLGAKDGSTMLLTNPIRLQHFDDLWIDLPGDEFAPGADGVFYRALFLGFSDDGAWLGADDVDVVSRLCASVYGFLPQQ
ncbi:MAG: hypothetical protein WCX97_00175 [Candidatus Magasanikbacteria bacterium]